MRVLFVSPHPDDSEIGCGATIHHMSTVWDVTVAVCAGQGDLRMVHSGATVTFDQRMEEQRLAAEVLGNVKLEWLGLAPAGCFDRVGQVLFVQAFDRLFRDFDEVYLPLPSYNKDHTVVWEAAMAAMRPGKADQTSFYAYEQGFGNAVGPQVTGIFGKVYRRVTVSDVASKARAIRCHASQMDGRVNSIYGEDGATALAKLRGLEVGVEYAEMVYLIRQVCF